MDTDAFLALPEAELLALGCLALPGISVDVRTLAQLGRLAAKKGKIGGASRPAAKWRAAVEAWRDRGLVIEQENGRFAVPHEREAALLLALGERPKAIRAVRDALLAQLGPRHALAPRIEARVALFANDRGGLEGALARLVDDEALDDVRELEAELIEQRFGPLPAATLRALDVAAVRPLLPLFVKLHIEKGGPFDEDARALLRDASTETRALAAIHHILTTGGDDGLLAGFDASAPSMVHEVRALAALAAGDVEGSRAAALDAWRALPRRLKKPHLDGPLAPLLAFVLATGDAEATAAARTHLTSIRSKERLRMTLAERLALAHLEGHPLPAPATQPEWSDVACHVILASARAKPSPGVPEALEEACRSAGYVWLADQLAALRAWGEKPTHPPEGLVFARLLRRREPWEITLDALENELGPLPGELQAKETEGTERLVWWVEVRDDGHGARLSVQPRLQRRNKGGWTAGAAVALRRLHRATDDQPWLKDEDRKVTACLSAIGGWRYGQPDLEFNRDVARALVGHPRVAWVHDPERRVEVVEKEPSVRVVEDEGGTTRILFHPPSPVGRSPVVERVGDVIEVYPLEGKRAEVARLIGRGIELPRAARPRLKPLLARLAPMVTVESDVDPEVVAGREIAADPRPVLRLARAGEGLKLEVKVAPLGLEGPMFLPGVGGRAVAAKVEGERLRCTRDLEREASLAEELQAGCPTVARTEVRRGLRTFDLAEGLEVLEELRALEQDVVRLWTDDDPIDLLPERSVGHFRISIQATDRDWLALDGTLELDDETVLDLRSLLERAPSRRGRFLQLDDTHFVALSESLTERLDLLSAARGEDPDEVHIPSGAAGLLAGWEDELGDFAASEEVRAQLQRAEEAAKLKPRTPRTFEAELRDYQREGYVWMRRLAHWGAGACLADDMGLGKTVQTLALLVARASEGPALVVAPTSVAGNWADEAMRFAPTLRVQLLSGAPEALEELTAFDLVVTSYGLLTLHAETFASPRWATVVLDEAQAIKNPDTQRARAAFSLQADFRVVTTGTPVENRVLELWSLMRFTNPGLLGSRAAFERRFAKPIASDPRGPAMHQLRRLVRPFVLRRTKREVLTELPSRTEVVHEVIPTPDEAAFSEALRRQALEQLEDAGPRATIEILAALTRLRQAACAPSLLRPDLELPSSKLDAFEELVEELVAGGHRALVFSQFVKFLELARARVEGMGLAAKYLDGSTPAAKRRAAVAAFQEGDGDLFFISLKAGGTGLNLTGADYVIHLDPWWNPAVEDQASDRAHRMGQTRPVTIYRLVTKGSIEERVLELHGEKRELAERLLDGTDAPVTPDAEALLELLR